jgi:DNA-binding MarR family transcriptional regulator
MYEKHTCQGDHGEFFRVVHSFRKLNISTMLPDLTHAELGTLSMIAKCKEDGNAEGVKVSELVTRMDVAAPAVSRTLKKLEEKKYIIRTVDKNDRRNTYVELTPEGTDIMLESKEIMHDFADAVLGEMGEENMNRLITYLKDLQNLAMREIDKRKYNNREDETEHGKDI